jgi:hypothetical protein
MALQTDQKGAQCLPNSSESKQFQNYINACRTSKDTSIATTFMSQTVDKYIGIFESQRAHYNDLMISADNLSSASGSSKALLNELNGMAKQKEKLKHEIEHYRTESKSADKMFLEDIYNKTSKKEFAPSLQDVALLLFWFGWLLISITLIVVRWSTGGWQAGLFSAVILLLVTVCLFAILVQVA